MKLTQVYITYFRCFESLRVPLQPDVNVFVGVNASGKTTLLDAIAIAYMAVAGSGHVHMGFQLVYEHVRPSVAKLLGACTGVRRILVTGHSLGAAVAILSGFELA